MDFRLWAPKATTVEIALDHRRIPMTPCPGGWWIVDVPAAGPETEYTFILDNSPPWPDPRSACQPHGVHGPSRVLDHQAFGWTDERWQPGPLASAVLYELHIGTFTPAGTFEAAIEYLDHLVALGVTHVELMPVAEFPGLRGWGYDGVDLYAPHHAYGGPEGLKRLVNAAHSKGLAVLLDEVYNHVGPAGNYLECFGPYFTTRHQTPWGQAVNLDGPGSEEVRRKALTGAFVYDGRYSHFRGRRHGRLATGLTGHHFLGYLQNHDQVGNRAQGERSSHLLSPGRLKIAAALVLTSPFIPLLFQGEEWGASTPFQYFTDHEDAELARAVSEGRRSEFAAFGWAPDEVPDPQAPATHLRSRLDWREPTREPHAGLLEWHRRLIRLRRQIPALADGRMEQVRVRFDEAARWMVLERGPVTVACNLAARAQTVPLAQERSKRILCASEAEVVANPAGVIVLPDAVVIRGPEEYHCRAGVRP